MYEWGYNRYLELDPDFLFPEQDYKFGREVTDEDLLHPDPSIAEVSIFCLFVVKVFSFWQISASGIRFLESLFRRFKSPDNTMPISCVRTMFDSLSLTRSPQVKGTILRLQLGVFFFFQNVLLVLDCLSF